jgi:hypothetical protein
VAGGVPLNLRGNVFAEVVRQTSDDGRDGGEVIGRLATDGQHCIIPAAPDRDTRGSLRAVVVPQP